jgi:hypothetical protein
MLISCIKLFDASMLVVFQFFLLLVIGLSGSRLFIKFQSVLHFVGVQKSLPEIECCVVQKLLIYFTSCLILY